MFDVISGVVEVDSLHHWGTWLHMKSDVVSREVEVEIEPCEKIICFECDRILEWENVQSGSHAC